MPSMTVRIVKTGLLIAMIAGASVSHAVTKHPMSAAKKQCPTLYYRDGNYCMPTKRAKGVIRRRGSCPGGWYRDGDFCADPKSK